ncbi:DUF1385 domain-containing protein [Brevibacillus humidisoli]|uniref:DUF1385 domain-containing protein n=1 Tax=Brevibacillus humidisoli TaxID=2895522 RepID=UPI001E48D9C1|nr:DUF1385 domain-containing protein [Brevibacillus humidisoli]UFJ43057.1 DUF1385 domain-containing protein [Brevibacillus humidisoli]
MITGISFGRGVIFHDSRVLACAEVREGVIHVWAEKITLRTIGKLWLRMVFTLPWTYQLFHLSLILYLLYPVWGEISPWWAIVYAFGFHFLFPRRLKMFHGAEHKVFSYGGEKKLEALAAIRQADIVNSGCSTNYVTYFFLCFLPALGFLPLAWSILIGGFGVMAGYLGQKHLRHGMKPLLALSAFLQRHVTTREPERLHLETAIRSYLLFQHYRKRHTAAIHTKEAAAS